MAKQSITLKLAGKPYSLKIDTEKEEAYRLAEREVNAYFASWAKRNVAGWADRDYMAVTALHFAITNIGLKQGQQMSDDDSSCLAALEQQLESYLEGLKP